MLVVVRPLPLAIVQALRILPAMPASGPAAPMRTGRTRGLPRLPREPIAGGFQFVLQHFAAGGGIGNQGDHGVG